MKKNNNTELNVTWAEYEPLYKRSLEIDARGTELRKKEGWHKDKAIKEEIFALSHEECALNMKMNAMRPHLIPEVGIPCTVYFYSDSSAAYIAEVPSPKTIVVQLNGLYTSRKVYTLRKNGSWIEKGSTLRDWSTHCALGYAIDYFDRSF